MLVPVLLTQDENRIPTLVVSAITTPSLDAESIADIAYPLGLRRIRAAQQFVVDGNALNQWSDAQSRLQSDAKERPSLLDAALYKPLIDAW